MQQIIDFITTNAVSIILVLFFLLVLTLIIAVAALLKVSKLQDMYEKFLGGSSKNTIEAILLDYYTQTKSIDERYSGIQKDLKKLEDDMESCLQKVAIVRYNPFKETGGNLCYALAMLNKKNDGVLINSIFSRDGSYNYGKPVVNGKSEFNLSTEEQEALDLALKQM